MKGKFVLMVFVCLLAVPLVLSTGRVFADDDGNHGIQNERRDLQRDRRQLEELRRQRNTEIREGDRGEARDYDTKIPEHENHLRNDRRELRRDERGDHKNEHQDRD